MSENEFMELILSHTEYAVQESSSYFIDMDGPISIKQCNEIIEACAEMETTEVTNRKEKLVRSILKEMTPQCKSLLWNYYAVGLSWSEVAAMHETITTSNSAKVSGRRCREKFEEKYNKLKTRIYG